MEKYLCGRGGGWVIVKPLKVCNICLNKLITTKMKLNLKF